MTKEKHHRNIQENEMATLLQTKQNTNQAFKQPNQTRGETYAANQLNYELLIRIIDFRKSSIE